MRLFLSIAFSLFSAVCFTAERVEYLGDSIMQKDGNTIRLLGGSSWELSSMSLAMVTEDIIIVFRAVAGNDERVIPIMYHGGMQIPVRHISGAYAASAGFLANVVDERNDGEILELDDGTVLTIPDYDQFDTGFWLPPYSVIVTSDGLYMWNLEEGKRVWIDGIR